MKLLEKQQTAIDYFIKSKGAVLEVIDTVKILRYDVLVRNENKPALALFIGNSAKRSSNYWFASEDKREAQIRGILDRESAHSLYKKNRLDEKKAFTPTSKAGDIFVSSWGYEQTNVDFYLCQSVKGKTGTFVRIGSKSVEGSLGHDSDRVVPDINEICGEPFKKLISKAGESESIRLSSYGYCRKWNGSSMHRSWGY